MQITQKAQGTYLQTKARKSPVAGKGGLSPGKPDAQRVANEGRPQGQRSLACEHLKGVNSSPRNHT